jgi:2-polyprenyl-3-methyl-5-hydroxy-6-metoxy-1,4-benzoquinol methylase
MQKDHNSKKQLLNEPEMSAHERLVNNYFKITSGENSLVGDYKVQTDVLKRGLGKWLNVKNRKVIDLGSGTGELCWLANEMGAESIIGVNLSQEEIDFAKKYVEATFVCQDILSYLSECPDESVDIIFALNILEHLTRDKLVKVLDKSRKILKSGGQLIAIVPNGTSAYGTMTRYWDFTHLQSFTPSSVLQLMRLCGFSTVDFREWGPRIHGIISLCRYLLWQIIRFTICLRLMIETGSVKGGVYTMDMIFRLGK